jgi:hypothetical protein
MLTLDMEASGRLCAALLMDGVSRLPVAGNSITAETLPSCARLDGRMRPSLHVQKQNSRQLLLTAELTAV